MKRDEIILSNGTWIVISQDDDLSDGEFVVYLRGVVAFKGNAADMVALRFMFERMGST